MASRVENIKADRLNTILNSLHGVAEAVRTIGREQDALRTSQIQLLMVQDDTSAVLGDLVNAAGETVTSTPVVKARSQVKKT